MIFRNIRNNFNLIFGQFSVARKLILNGGAIRPTGLLSVLARTFPRMILNHWTTMDLIELL